MTIHGRARGMKRGGKLTQECELAFAANASLHS